MKYVESIQTFDQIKLLADARRMTILRLLMDSPATLSHLAQSMGQSPAWVRHHIKILEAANMIELAEVRARNTVTEKYYRAKASAYLLQEVILPKSKKPVVVFSGSHDLALEGIADHITKHITLLNMPVGSLDGLVNLRQGLCQISGSHLLDDSGDYNTPFVRHFFPDRDMEIITLANRTQGLIVAAGNPKGIKQVTDITRPDVRFMNRNAGSGTRLWLDKELKQLGIPSENINGYDSIVSTHSEAALAIASGNVDVSLGLQAAAHQHGLDFIPLFEERYDLILPQEQEETLTPLLDYLQTVHFRHELNSLTGYNPKHSGEQIPL